MIITVTMNPAIDKTVELIEFEHGGLNRLKNVIIDAGGKGINVSKTIQALGGETIATGFLGGSSGKVIETVLEKLDISSDFVFVGGETRTNMKVVEENGYVTELNEPGPEINCQDIDTLTSKLLKYASEDALFIFAGSIPQGVPKDIYQQLILKVKEKGARAFLDADGDLFVNSLSARPDIIKPNQDELIEYFKYQGEVDEKALLEMGTEFLTMGIGMVVISLGKDGAFFLSAKQRLKISGLKVRAHSTVGAGDAMVAAMAYGLNQGMAFADCARLSVATSAGAVTTIGTKPPARELVDELLESVEVIEL